MRATRLPLSGEYRGESYDDHQALELTKNDAFSATFFRARWNRLRTRAKTFAHKQVSGLQIEPIPTQEWAVSPPAKKNGMARELLRNAS
jgi:hypothetical protein